MVSARIVVASATGILKHCNRSSLVEFGGHIQLNRHWAYSLLSRMNFVKRKVTTAKSKQSSQQFSQLKETFLSDITSTVEVCLSSLFTLSVCVCVCCCCWRGFSTIVTSLNFTASFPSLCRWKTFQWNSSLTGIAHGQWRDRDQSVWRQLA